MGRVLSEDEIFRKNGGQFRMSEAIAQGITRYMLYSLRDSGIIEQVRRGVLSARRTWSMGIVMDYKALLENYTVLLEEVKRLTKENSRLRAQREITEPEPPGKNLEKKRSVEKKTCSESIVHNFRSVVDNGSDSCAKIHLFMSLFKGRSDVYAKRWENKNKGTSGFSPVCLNQWQAGVFKKPKISCSKCENKDYAA